MVAPGEDVQESGLASAARPHYSDYTAGLAYAGHVGQYCLGVVFSIADGVTDVTKSQAAGAAHVGCGPRVASRVASALEAVARSQEEVASVAPIWQSEAIYFVEGPLTVTPLHRRKSQTGPRTSDRAEQRQDPWNVLGRP